MRATRALFFSVNAILWILNGWVLLQHAGIFPLIAHSTVGALIANILVIPLLTWTAYRTGQLVEENYRDVPDGKKAPAGNKAKQK